MNPLKEKKIPVVLENIKYHREDPSELFLKLEQAGNSVGITLTLKYKEGYRHYGLGSFCPVCCFASQEQFDESIEKARIKAEEFYEKTLEILHNGNYELHSYDNGNLEMIVNGKKWKVQYAESLVSHTS